MRKLSKNHWRCCWHPVACQVLWILAVLAVIFAWTSIYREFAINAAVPTDPQAAAQLDPSTLPYGGSPNVFGINAGLWYWTALVLGVLSIGAKGTCGHCGECDNCRADDKS